MPDSQGPSVGSQNRQVMSNALLAVLTALICPNAEGVVTATEPYRPAVTDTEFTLIEVVAVSQTEVSLSIYATDPMLQDGAERLRELIPLQTDEEMVQTVNFVDHMIHEKAALLTGRREQVLEVAELLRRNGHVDLRQVKALLGH